MIILHGENQAESRRRLQEIRDRRTEIGDEVVVLDGLKATMTELKQAIESVSLFGHGRLVVVEGLRREVVMYLESVDIDNLVVWEGKKLSPTVVKELGGQDEEFKISPEIFKLVDSLKQNNGQVILRYWESSIKQDEVEMIFHMLCRQVRMLIQARSDPESLSGNPYVVRKVEAQARCFSIEQLLEMHRKLYVIDRGQKMGSTPLLLAHEVELWLLEI